MLEVGLAIKPKHVISMGDTVDFYGVSSHSRDPVRMSTTRFKREVEAGRNAIDELYCLGAKNNVFLLGNHEHRLLRYLMDKAPELYELEELSIKNLLRLDKSTVIPYREDYKLGKLYVVHDIGVAGRYTPQRMLDAYGHNIVGGHTHRLSYIVEGNAAGDAHVSATFGWLGDRKKVDYMYKIRASKDWALGFGVAWLDTSNGNVHVQPVPIVRYKCVVGGKEYSA